MKLNEELKLVLPIGDAQAFHTPISRDVFELNYRILSGTKAALESRGVYYQMGTGPRIAALTLKDEARKDAESTGLLDDAGEPSVAAATALLMEIKRLTMVIVSGQAGYEYVSVDQAMQRGVIDSEDWGEAEAAIVFFTCHYVLALKSERQRITQATASLLRGSITSSSLLEFVASLPTSTGSESTMPESSVPI